MHGTLQAVNPAAFVNKLQWKTYIDAEGAKIR
jgi:hypothetical protein